MEADYGKPERHATAGTVAVGARMPLVAYNVNLDTPDIAVADKIMLVYRHIGGGLRFVQKPWV